LDLENVGSETLIFSKIFLERERNLKEEDETYTLREKENNLI